MEHVLRRAFEAGNSWAVHHSATQDEPGCIYRGHTFRERSARGDGEQRYSIYIGNNDLPQHTHAKVHFVSSQALAPGLPGVRPSRALMCHKCTSVMQCHILLLGVVLACLRLTAQVFVMICTGPCHTCHKYILMMQG